MLTEQQLASLTKLFDLGSKDATQALSRWLGREARVAIAEIEQVPLAEATAVLGDAEEPVCFCAMSLSGGLTGELILSLDDASGLALADLLLNRPAGISTVWGEIEISAALETANIIGCAYLNALTAAAPDRLALLPSPPRFSRDFPGALLEFALMSQAVESDMVFMTRTEFAIAESPVDCNLLLVPDSASLSVFKELLA